MIRRLVSIAALALIASPLPAIAQAVESFEETASGWTASGGAVALSEDHWKLGERSLRWEFEPGGALHRAADDALATALASPTGGIRLWLYCERPIEGDLQFRVGRWSFPVHLGFTGWRAAWVLFAEDAMAAEPVEGMIVTAPDSAGAIFLDAVEIGSVPWHRQGDAQTPYTNPKRFGGQYWHTLHDHAQTPPPEPPREFTAEDAAAFRQLEQRLEQWMFGRMDDPREPVAVRLESIQRYIERGHDALENLGLQRRGEVVTEPGAFGPMETGRLQLASDIFQPIALPLAYDARLNDSAQARQRFVDLIDYAHDQGWAADSIMGTNYGGELRIASYVNAVYILRNHLREQGRLERELRTLHYQLSIGEMYREPEHPGASADSLRTLLLFRLLYVLMLDDGPEKLRDMDCYLRWAESALSVARGHAGTIKPDGTVFHHSTAYASAYGNNAMMMSAVVYWLLDGTPFALSEEAGGNIREALLALRFMGGKYHVPMGVSGRWPFSGPVLYDTASGFAYLADALDDPVLGAAFSRLWDPDDPAVQDTFDSCGARIWWSDTPGDLPFLLDAAERWPAEPDPTGHRAFPFAAMSCHRRDDWVASVRGWSRYVWNYESSANQNRYGRYSSYGMLQLFTQGDPNAADSGYVEPGWDWLRPPGATVIRVPLESLHTSPVIPRQYTQDSFVGGVALEGRHGAWAMRFADPCYEPSFRFRKSVFFVDGTIVCVGSGITNADAEHPTETVLYQVALPETPERFPLEETVTTQWLLDPVANGYYFPQAQAVRLLAHHQRSMHNSAASETEGDFALAWIDHGAAPNDAGYVYAMRPKTSAAAMEQYAAAPDFTLLQQDDAAHIVVFPAAGITAAALFEPSENLRHGPVRSVSAPCLVMTRQEGERLIVAVADPDLRMDETGPDGEPGGVGALLLSIPGWTLAAGPGNVSSRDDGSVEILCRDGASYEMTFTRPAGGG